MKRLLLIAAFAFAIFPACTKVEQEELPAVKISFNVSHYSAGTKADPGTVSNLQSETNQFSSKAFLHAAGYKSRTQDMFGTAGDLVKYHAPAQAGDRAVWEPDNEYFWPKMEQSYINFVSWYSNVAGLTTQMFNPENVSELQMNWGTASNPVTIDSDDNILFADLAYKYSNNATRYTSVSNVSEGVPTLFHHALAKVAFKIKLKTSTQTTKTIWDVSVQSVSLKVGNNGYLPLTIAAADTTGHTTGTIPWKVNGVEATSTIIGWSRPAAADQTLETVSGFESPVISGFAPTDASNLESNAEWLLAERTVMPQTLGSTVKFGITFKIDIFHADANGEKDGSAYSQEIVTISERDLASLVSSIPEWHMNTKYIYTITIDPVSNKVYFDPAVYYWIENTENVAIER